MDNIFKNENNDSRSFFNNYLGNGDNFPLNNIVNKEQTPSDNLSDKKRKRTETKPKEESDCRASFDESKKTLFTTLKGNGQDTDMKKMMRLLKNRLSAKKCRQKKKSYVETLESQIKDLQDELDRYQEMEKKDRSLQSLINLVKLE